MEDNNFGNFDFYIRNFLAFFRKEYKKEYFIK